MFEPGVGQFRAGELQERQLSEAFQPRDAGRRHSRSGQAQPGKLLELTDRFQALVSDGQAAQIKLPQFHATAADMGQARVAHPGPAQVEHGQGVRHLQMRHVVVADLRSSQKKSGQLLQALKVRQRAGGSGHVRQVKRLQLAPVRDHGQALAGYRVRAECESLELLAGLQETEPIVRQRGSRQGEPIQALDGFRVGHGGLCGEHGGEDRPSRLAQSRIGQYHTFGLGQRGQGVRTEGLGRRCPAEE